MLLSDVPYKIEKLKKKYGTADPFKIAEKIGIIILYGYFGNEVYGFYNKFRKQKFIHLNIELSYLEQRFVCGHELFHAIFHPDENTARMTASSFCSTSKIEAQANCGATYLLIDGSHRDELYLPTKQDILNFYGLPIEMGKFLYSSVI
ncbi:ImmA/IrrE family metallo-endopeptidase [Enterococcus sp. DIV1420a]|uniref:ImmA/IrrE family metallo-endopeptidase n=1 Tax=Enterococcus sp. DIV1420a TaxID=2774672 RepID=UPI003F203D04